MSVSTQSLLQAPNRSAGSMADQAYRVLLDRIVLLDIAPGEPLNDGTIAEELGLGRTPVREALKRLEVDHLVITYPRRGTFATKVDISELTQINQVRLALEPVAASQAARNRGGDFKVQMDEVLTELRALRATHDSMSDFEDGYALLNLDLRVHRSIYSAANNPHLEETLVRLDNLITRIWMLLVDRMPTITHHIEEHIQLLEAIRAGDVNRAGDLAGKHVAGFEEAIRSAL